MNSVKYFIISISVLVVLIILGGIVFSVAGYLNKQEITTTVVDKQRVVVSNGDSVDSYYLIYTEDGTLKLADDLFYMNFESSDQYGKIRVDSTYTFQTIGYRIGFLSSYPKIVGF